MTIKRTSAPPHGTTSTPDQNDATDATGDPKKEKSLCSQPSLGRSPSPNQPPRPTSPLILAPPNTKPPPAHSNLERTNQAPKTDSPTLFHAQRLRQVILHPNDDSSVIFRILGSRNTFQNATLENTYDFLHGHLGHTLRSNLKERLNPQDYQNAIRILDRGRARSPVVGTPRFESTLDAATNSVRRPGNVTSLLLDGRKAFESRVSAIRSARKSIYLQTFIFNDDITGWNLARELVLRAQEGIDVRVIYDGLGSLRANPIIFQYLAANGVKVKEYGSPLTAPFDLNARWHEKHLIVDHQAAIEGGRNVASEYATGKVERGPRFPTKRNHPWRDVDTYIQGPVVEDIAQGFLGNWRALGGEPATPHDRMPPWPTSSFPTAPIRFVQNDPVKQESYTQNMYLNAIHGAKNSITIESAYFIPPPLLNQALINAANRGVKVRIMTNSPNSTDMPITANAARHFYPALVKAWVEVYERNGSTLHSKTMVVDGHYSIIGSVNLNGRSRWCDTESLVAINDPSLSQELEASFEQGLASTTAIRPSDLTSSTAARIGEWALSFLHSNM